MTNNYIEQYYAAITSGTIIAGKWIKAFYRLVVEGIASGKYIYNHKKARKAIRFIETFCHHSEGRNDVLTLELWQKALVSVLFGVLDHEGLRQFREAVLVVGRKNGKTLFASAIIAYMAYLDGEYGAKIYCVAPKLDQAEIIYSDFYQTVLAENELKNITKKRKSDIYIADTNTSVKKIAFNSKKSDGFNPHLAVCDEIASWAGDRGLKQYEVLKSAMGSRRQPLLLSISTAGYENESIYDELMKRCTSMLLGNSEERRLAAFLYIIDDPQKWDDINELYKSNPNMGVSVQKEYLEEEILIAKSSRSKKVEFLTKYCNIKQNSSQAWLPFEVVEAATCEQLSLEDFRHCYCVGGIDLSRTTDLTSCCIVIEKQGILYVFSKFFMAADRLQAAIEEDSVPYDIYRDRGLLTITPGHYVDYRECYQWYRDLVDKYKIYPLQIGYDRYTAQYLVQDLAQARFHVDDVYQGTNLTPVITELDGILKDGKMKIGDNDLLKLNMLNAALKMSSEDDKVKLIKVSKRARIDGMAALLDAMCVRQKWHGEIGGQLKNER